MSLRIIAGKHKGRTITLGKQIPQVRPTSSFARGAIFNIISHGAYADASPLEGRAVADICCGSGAFGLEALSRGAAQVTFVDKDIKALQVARSNAEAFGESEHATFVRTSLPDLPMAQTPYALIFMDPPYFSGVVKPTLKRLKEAGWITPESLIIVEQDVREDVNLPPGFTEEDCRRYGRAMIRLLRLTQ